MLIQIDGSHHRWPEERGPQFTLLLAVDDATGCVSNALFCPEETTRSYFRLLEGLIRHWDVPLSLYTDRHSVFTPPLGSGQKARATMQFTRAMDELGVQLIFVRSPQGKGRVERMAGTFHDRLVSELRIAGASTIAETNRVLQGFLPHFNEQFRVPAQQWDSAYRTLHPDVCLESILCFKHWRRVARDNTLKYRWHTLQLLPDAEQGSYAGTKVEVLEGLDGTLRVQHEGSIIASQEAPPRPGIMRNSNTPPILTRNSHLNGTCRYWRDKLASLQAKGVADNGVHKPVAVLRRKPKRLQRAWWNAIHQAKLNGVSIWGIANK